MLSFTDGLTDARAPRRIRSGVDLIEGARRGWTR